MSDKTRHITSSDGRARVAYEMAKAMWWESKNNNPTTEDEDEFLKLVNNCTRALSYRDG